MVDTTLLTDPQFEDADDFNDTPPPTQTNKNSTYISVHRSPLTHFRAANELFSFYNILKSQGDDKLASSVVAAVDGDVNDNYDEDEGEYDDDDDDDYISDVDEHGREKKGPNNQVT